MSTPTRRTFLAGLSLAAGFGSLPVHVLHGQAPRTPDAASADPGRFLPYQDPALVREVVGASHRDLARVRELVERQPALANATIDWSFGDWESALGAASHVGRREIAELLIAHGARPSLFSAAMLGQLDVVKAFVSAAPGIQRTYGPHGITLLAHARAGGAGAIKVREYLEGLGDADRPLPTAPLDPADRAALVGTYAFGSGEADVFVVDVRNDLPGIERPGHSRSILRHTGALVFFPAGVPSARIAFAREAGRMTRLTIADPEVFLTAVRRA